MVMAGGAAATIMEIEIDSDVEEVCEIQDAFAIELAKQLKPEPADLPDEDCLPRESDPYPPLPDPTEASTGDRAKAAAAQRQQTEKEAAAALAANDVQRAVDAYTLAMRTTGATAMMLANRAALLLKLKRPCAAIRDCTAALKINGSMVKAFRVRGIAHRKLGHWRRAHSDVSEAQALKFDAATAEMQKFLTAQCVKLDIVKDKGRTGSRAKPVPKIEVFSTDPFVADLTEGRAEELLRQQVAVERPQVNLANDLSKGQAVVLSGLQKAPHLNGKRAVVERTDPRPASKGRWEVEVRLDGGRLEVKSLKRDNIQTLNKADRAACKAWAQAEKRHKEERQQREDQEEHNKFQKCVDAKISKYPLSQDALSLLKGLRPQDALSVLDKVDDKVTNVNEFVKTQVGLLTGQSDSDDEPASKRHKS